MSNPLRIGSRRSRLAMTQSRHVATVIEQRTGRTCEIVQIDTTGDKVRDVPLPEVGGKGLFTKELEDQLLDGSIDIAVHSLKDLPGELPAGLVLGAISEREDPRDAAVVRSAATLMDLPAGAVVGTGSVRRAAQVRTLRNDVDIRDIRGNVPTRLRKLDEGQYDAIILAAAGLRRLGLADRITAEFSIEEMIPASGQGALGIECRDGDREVLDLLARSINDERTSICCGAERHVQARLNAGCNAPAGVNARLDGDDVIVTAFVSDKESTRMLHATERGPEGESNIVAERVAAQLIEDGANELLDSIRKSIE